MKFGDICLKCNSKMTDEDKDYTKNKYFNHCLSCYRELRRLWAKKHYDENREREIERRKKYATENRDKINAARRERNKLKKEQQNNSPNFK